MMESTGHQALDLTSGLPDELVSRGDIAEFQDALLRLLEHRTAVYTMGDSTSVPTHVAADLLRSICFVLGIDPEARVIPEQLLDVDLAEHYRRRLDELSDKVKAAEKLWRDVCLAMPVIENVALRDTLAAIGDFFKSYDHRSMAHEIPCSIDYPLCHPVDESLLGVDYIAEYLRRLMIEARFLQLFEIPACERVLASASPDHVELLVNLYEPVAVNAFGLALLHEEPRPLEIGEAGRQGIEGLLAPLGTAGRERALREAVVRLGDVLEITAEDEREYLLALVPELLPRLEVALAHHDLRGVFLGPA